MKKSRIFMALILAVLFVFTASALELDVAEADAVLSADTAEYGELVFHETFESLNGKVNDGSYMPTLMTGAFAGKKAQLYSGGSGSTYSVETPTGMTGKMLAVGGGVNYPSVRLINLGLDKPGTYIFMYDYYIPSTTVISFLQSGIGSSTRITFEKGSIKTVTHTKEIANGASISMVLVESGFANPCIYLDNFKIFYKPEQTLTLPDIISDNMLVQKGADIPVWGETNVTDSIDVSLVDGETVLSAASLTVTDGSFDGVIPSVNGYYDSVTLVFEKDGNVIDTVENVAVGELWHFSGQSNMQARFFQYPDEMTPTEENSSLRYYDAAPTGTGKWLTAESDDFAGFGVVSYYTLEEMYSVLNTPVGAINTAVAGTTMAKYMGVCDFSAQGGELYNSLIAPLSKIPVTGHFWYQGESDQSNANFVDYLEALIGTWRANWNNENMPFIYTQLPRSAATFPSWWGDVDENGNPTSTTTYNFSDAHMWQLSLYQKMKNNGVYMSVAIDTTTKIENQKSVENPDYEDPLHPRNKAPIGKRMADIALNAVYGKTEIKHLSPVPVEFELSGNEITITFEGVYDGLETTDGNAPKHFEIVNQAGVYVQPDSIEIVEGNKIVLSSDSITEPKGVAYFYEEHFVDMSVAFAELVPTLTNSEALPASPFVYTFPVKAPDEGYGELIFLETFEGMEGTVANTSNLPSYMLGTYEGKKVMVYDRGAGSSYKVATPVENGGNMLEISGGNYPQMTLLNLGLNKAGTYVVMFDYYLASNTTISFMQAGFNNSNTRFDDVVKGAVTPVVLTKTISEGETISSIDIQTGFTNPALYIDNIRIYYSESAAPVAIKANSIRTSGDAGIRFISFANKAVRASASEYGHMVAIKDDSVSDYNTALVFADGERTEGVAATNEHLVKYLYAANYIKDSKDVVYSENGDFLPENLSMGDDGVYFTSVMTNIPEQAYNIQLVVRPYAVIGDNIFYGNVVSKSIYEVAVEMKNSEGYVENAYIENIIDTVENA